MLLLTPLKAVDGKVYAVAQGPLSIGGFNVGGGRECGAAKSSHSGHDSRRGIVERTVETNFVDKVRSFHSSIAGARFCDRFSYVLELLMRS